ncbi:MAG: isoprenylcysteine carboxylmethyltransferase family protein [candidate division KSB1 bacterium]|nr:isoprenylcysteine carboxylmethyltransferase family protein [candidate division KSB1 bacterium]MDZ7274546.1 isoprenylcysteine carboxylmethyltransferase family protein [candidate division KSB1 bacterium]MDZ7284793.1 isoprenylcysteine carboxylmethyltransferase family protein [candidate division KSB1 bacterium]MDZ7297787.1 isoprenylcysteine carboxylmethyltransferase family protein [candidate division KSB1 bacterium]MDZ7306424.1 isoprenylcysteine carboxylmethyltransferase family protein [candidat
MDLRQWLFKYRSYTPIPLLLVILWLANPTPLSLISGFLIALTGESLRLWGVRHAGGATRTTGPVGAGAELITHGPFAHVRNPLYLGNFVLSLGLCVMANAWMPWMLLVFVTAFAWQYRQIIALEEEHLQQRFGQVYTDYFNHVPRFLPRLTPFKKQQVEVMPLRRALKIERNTLMSFAAVSLAIFLLWRF